MVENRAICRCVKMVYLDAVNVLPEVIRFGCQMVGSDRMLYASDHPWVDPKLTRDNIRSLKLPPRDEAKIFGGNAKGLFNL